MPDLSLQEFNDLVSNAFKIPNFSLSPLSSPQRPSSTPRKSAQQLTPNTFSRSSILFKSHGTRSDSRLDAYTNPLDGPTSFVDPSESNSRLPSFIPPWIRRRNSDATQRTDDSDKPSDVSATQAKGSALSSILTLKSRSRPLLRRKSAVSDLRQENLTPPSTVEHLSFFDDSGYNERLSVSSPLSPQKFKLSPPAIPRSRSKPQLRSFLPLPPTPKTAKSLPSSPLRKLDALPAINFSAVLQDDNEFIHEATASSLSLSKSSKRQLPPYSYPPPPYPSPTSPLPSPPHISTPRRLQPHRINHKAVTASNRNDEKPVALRSLQQHIHLKTLPARLRKVASNTLITSHDDTENGSVDSEEILSWRNCSKNAMSIVKDPPDSPSPMSIRSRLGLGPRVRTDPGLQTRRDRQRANKAPSYIRSSHSAAALYASSQSVSPLSSGNASNSPSTRTNASASALSLNSSSATVITTKTNSSTLSSEKRNSLLGESRRSMRWRAKRKSTAHGEEEEDILTLGRVLTPDVDPFAGPSPGSPTSIMSPQCVPRSPLSPTSSLFLNSPTATRSSLPPSLLNALGPSYPYYTMKEPLTPQSDHSSSMSRNSVMSGVPESIQPTLMSLSLLDHEVQLVTDRKEKPTHSTSTSTSSITVKSGVPGHSNSRPHSPFPLLFVGPNRRGQGGTRANHSHTPSASSSLSSGLMKGLAALHRSGSGSRAPTAASVVQQNGMPLDRVGEDGEDTVDSNTPHDIVSSTAWYLATPELNTRPNSMNQFGDVPIGLGLVFDSPSRTNVDTSPESNVAGSTGGFTEPEENAWPLPPKRTVILDEETSSGWHDVEPSVQYIDLKNDVPFPLRNRHSIRFPSSPTSLPVPLSLSEGSTASIVCNSGMVFPPSPTSPSSTSRSLSKHQARAIAQQYTHKRGRVTSDASSATAAGTSLRSAYYTASESVSTCASMSSCVSYPDSFLPKMTMAVAMSPPSSPFDSRACGSAVGPITTPSLQDSHMEIRLGPNTLVNLPSHISFTDYNEVLSLMAPEWSDLVSFCTANDAILDTGPSSEAKKRSLCVSLFEVTNMNDNGGSMIKMSICLSSQSFDESREHVISEYVFEKPLSTFAVPTPARLEEIVALGGRISIGTGLDKDESLI